MITDVQGFQANGDGSTAVGLVLSGGGIVPFPGSGGSIAVINALTATTPGSALDAVQGAALNTSVAAAASAASSASTAASSASAAAASASTAASNALAATVVQRVADTNTVTMNVSGAGQAMPVTPGKITVVAARTITPGATADGGSNTATYSLGAPLTLSGFDSIVCPASIISSTTTANGLTTGGVIASGNVVLIAYAFLQGLKTVIVNALGTVDTSVPIFGTPTISNSTPGVINVPITEVDPDAIAGTTANIHLSGANGGGKTLGTPTLTANVLSVPFSPAAAYGDAISIGFDAGYIVNTTNGLGSAMLSATAVTNNITVPAPTAPTVTDGSNTSSSVVGTLTAGAGQTPTSYILSYKLHSASSYTTGPTVSYTGASTPFSITGLTASSSYDVTAVAVGAGGTSPASGVMTSSTAAGSSTSLAIASGTPRSGALNFDAVTLGGASATNWIYASPAGGETVYQSGSLTKSLASTSGASLSANGSWGVTVSSAAQGLSATAAELSLTDATSGTATQFTYSLSGFATGTPVTLEFCTGSYNASTATVTASLADSSHAPATISASLNDTNQVFKINYTPGTSTTLNLSISSPNSGGADYVFSGYVIVYPGTL